MQFLEEETQSEERISMAKAKFELSTEPDGSTGKVARKVKPVNNASQGVATAAGLVAARETKANPCIFCQDQHESASCPQAKLMPLSARQSIAKDKRACFKCLKLNHGYRKCRYRENFPWCNRKHVILMCRDVGKEEAATEKKDDKLKSVENLSAFSKNVSSISDIYLQTLRVILKGPADECIVRVLIDPGAHRSYVLGSVAEQVNLRVVGQQKMVHLLFGGVKTEPRVHYQYEVTICSLDGSRECCLKAFHQDEICKNLPVVPMGDWIHTLKSRNILLSDVGRSQEPIALLLGADVAGRLYTGKIEQLVEGPTALETKLGWTLMGKNYNREPGREDATLVVLSMFSQNATISDLWQLDVLAITDPAITLSKEQHLDNIKRQFQQTIRFDEEEKRYEVHLPWKENHPQIKGNKIAAEKMLHVTTKKLNEANLYEEYDKIFKNWLQQRIIERVPWTDLQETTIFCHIDPH